MSVEIADMENLFSIKLAQETVRAFFFVAPPTFHGGEARLWVNRIHACAPTATQSVDELVAMVEHRQKSDHKRRRR